MLYNIINAEYINLFHFITRNWRYIEFFLFICLYGQYQNQVCVLTFSIRLHCKTKKQTNNPMQWLFYLFISFHSIYYTLYFLSSSFFLGFIFNGWLCSISTFSLSLSQFTLVYLTSFLYVYTHFPRFVQVINLYYNLHVSAWQKEFFIKKILYFCCRLYVYIPYIFSVLFFLFGFPFYFENTL